MGTKQELETANENLKANIANTFEGADPFYFYQACKEIAVTFTLVKKYVAQDVFKKYKPMKPTQAQYLAITFQGLNKEIVDSLKKNPGNILNYTVTHLQNKRIASDTSQTSNNHEKSDAEKDRTRRYEAMANILQNKDSSLATDIENYCQATYAYEAFGPS